MNSPYRPLKVRTASANGDYFVVDRLPQGQLAFKALYRFYYRRTQYVQWSGIGDNLGIFFIYAHKYGGQQLPRLVLPRVISAKGTENE